MTRLARPSWQIRSVAELPASDQGLIVNKPALGHCATQRRIPNAKTLRTLSRPSVGVVPQFLGASTALPSCQARVTCGAPLRHRKSSAARMSRYTSGRDGPPHDEQADAARAGGYRDLGRPRWPGAADHAPDTERASRECVNESQAGTTIMRKCSEENRNTQTAGPAGPLAAVIPAYLVVRWGNVRGGRNTATWPNA